MAFALAAGLGLFGARVEWVRSLDRTLFGWLSGGMGQVAGDGTSSSPRVLERREPGGPVAPPRVLVVDENPEGYFERVPPPPSDLMVMLARLHGAGLEHIAFGYPLQWENPDTLALEAMRGVMDRFDRTVIGYVVKDSTAPMPVPPPFLRASVPYAAVEGDAAKLPVVNGVVGMAPEFGGDRSWAGFIRIQTEKEDENRDYLLARWSDRVVFSLPLALEIARRGLSPEEVRVRVGDQIALGRLGPRIPIDFRGRVELPGEGPGREAVPATAVISEEVPQGFLSAEAPVFLTDERLLGEKGNRRWARRLPRLDAAVRDVPQVVGRTEMPYWPMPAVVIQVLVLALGGAWLSMHGSLGRRMAVVTGFGLGVAGLLMAMIHGGIGAPMPLALVSVPVLLLGAQPLLDLLLPSVEVVAGGEGGSGSTGNSPGKRREGPARRNRR